MQILMTTVGLGLVFGGLGLTLSFGLLALMGFPVLIVGLGVLSASLDD